MSRSEIDLRLGAAFTRFQTLRLQSRFPELSSQIVSYGPCQFPTLGFVVQRYMQRENFVSEPFWRIDVALGSTHFHWARQRLFDRTACALLYEMCVQAPTARVVSVTGKPRRRWKPLPLATIEFPKGRLLQAAPFV